MKKGILLSFCLGLLFLSGCASGPKFSDAAKNFQQLNPETGRVFVYRNSAFGAAIQPEIKLNGDVIGRAVPMGFTYVDLTPGNYEMMTSTEVDRSLSFTLEKNQTRYVRLGISMGFFAGHVYPELVENSLGEKEIVSCSYVEKK